MMMKSFSFLLIFFFVSNSLFAQDTLVTKRLKPLLITSGLIYTGSMVALSKIWYEEHEKTSFHFFNDNAEWNQMDKIGHFYTTFHLSAISYEGLRWSGLNKRKSALFGTAAGLLMILPVELLDGYSEKYGASSGDIIANFAGGAFFLAQQKLWNDIRVTPKFSFHRSPYAPVRPEVLGNGVSEEWLKDYNGQTYWLSFDTDKFLNSNRRWVDFVNLAVGYGSEGMVYARNTQNSAAGYEAHRQYYLSVDLDLTAINTNKKWLKRLFYVINTLHLPAPAISFDSKEKLKFHPIYF